MPERDRPHGPAEPSARTVRLHAPHLHATVVVELAFAAASAIIAVASPSLPGRVLALAGVVGFTIAAIDAGIPRRFRLTSDGITYRGSFRWHGWTWQEIDHVSVHTSTWFGRPTNTVRLHLTTGKAVLLDDTRTWRAGPSSAGSAEDAMRILNSAIHDPVYRAVLVAGT